MVQLFLLQQQCCPFARRNTKQQTSMLPVISVLSRFMCRTLMAALGRAYYFCMGFRVVVKGRQVSSSEAPILAVAPHSTFFDGIVCIVAGLPSTVSRVENLATPIFGSETLFICIVVCCCKTESTQHISVTCHSLFYSIPDT